MKLASRRLSADVAAARQRLSRECLDREWRPLQEGVDAHRATWLLGGGFVGGVLMARSPGRWMLGSLSTVLGIASFVLRTPIGSMLIASVATTRSKPD